MDDDLFKRFNALKAPTIAPVDTVQSVDHTQKAAQDAKAEDEELAAIAEGRVLPEKIYRRQGVNEDKALFDRMRSLKGEYGDLTEGADELGDDEVEAYLANLDVGQVLEEPIVEPSKEKDADLWREAQAAVKATEGLVNRESKENDDETGSVEDLETEDEIVSRALDEAAIEKDEDPNKRPTEASPTIPSSSPSKATGHKDKSEDLFAFPSLPTHEPVASAEQEEGEEYDDLKKRMDLLLGLKGPSTAPSTKTGPVLPSVPKREAGQGWNLPGYNDTRDNDLDSWCCICNKDAELVCAGCDDDLYCTECWKEGHEFEKHRVKKFVWGKKKLVGAA